MQTVIMHIKIPWLKKLTCVPSMSVNSVFYVLGLQFKRSPPKVPYKAIALAAVLFLIGSLLIIIGSLLLAGYFGVTVSKRLFTVHNFSMMTFKMPLVTLTRFLQSLSALRSNHSSPGHRNPCFSSWNLPLANSLLCIKRIPWILL